VEVNGEVKEKVRSHFIRREGVKEELKSIIESKKKI
jgi:hypothetical protein